MAAGARGRTCPSAPNRIAAAWELRLKSLTLIGFSAPTGATSGAAPGGKAHSLRAKLTRSDEAAHNGRSRSNNAGGKLMANHPVILKALCAAFVGCLVLPLGGLLFPYLDIPVLPFNVIEAVVSATVGFGIAELLG